MKFAINLIALLIFTSIGVAKADFRFETLKGIVREQADFSPSAINQAFDINKSKLGEMLFEDTSLSYNSNISCRTCHLSEFSSGDGFSIAIGVGTTGEGAGRNIVDGELLTRNTLPLWGRGAESFHSFFWDGRVEVVGDSVVSQFGKVQGKEKALNIAIHLPFSEIDEMINENSSVENLLETERVETAEILFGEITRKVRSQEEYVTEFRKAYGLRGDQITFNQIADAISHFIRNEFAIENTQFFDSLNGRGTISQNAVDGGLLFFGKGKCSICHSGSLFTDFKYHVIPTIQFGYGKNGFGIDYGRFNVTHSDNDLYAFRTPPLYNVYQTAPYMHSGSIGSLNDAVRAHFDPLGIAEVSKMDALDRSEFYRRLKLSTPINISFLSKTEVSNLVEFLKTLSFSKGAR